MLCTYSLVDDIVFAHNGPYTQTTSYKFPTQLPRVSRCLTVVVCTLLTGGEICYPQFLVLSGNSLGQTVHTHRTSVHQAAKLIAALLRVVGVTAGLAESNGSLPSGINLAVGSHHLQADCRDQLRNATLGNRVWATFFIK